jgi:hypothetical protein
VSLFFVRERTHVHRTLHGFPKTVGPMTNRGRPCSPPWVDPGNGDDCQVRTVKADARQSERLMQSMQRTPR